MDPVNILPVEVIHEIWCKLPFADILSCMIVSRSWYESISDCSKLWRPLCSSINLTNGNTWKSIFMKEAKIRWSWRKGLFIQKKVIKVIDGYKILNCNEDNIYIVDENNKLWKYDQTAVNLASIQLDNDCVQMCTIIDKIVLLLCVNTIWNELVFFNELFEELARVRIKKDNKIYKAGDRLWTWEYTNNNNDMMSVYCAKNLEQVEQVNIPYGTTVMPLQPGWCTLNRGEVWWLNGNTQTKLFASYMSPMARPCIDILTNNKDRVVVLDTKLICRNMIIETSLLGYIILARPNCQSEILEKEMYLIFLFFSYCSKTNGLPLSWAQIAYESIMEEMIPTMSALDATDLNASMPERIQQGKTAEEEICFTEECIHTASYLLDSMDLSAEPCDDFYQFACGKFRKQTIPDDKESLSTFTTIAEVVKMQLRTIVSEPIKPDEPRHLINPKNLYKICMDKETIEEHGLEDAQKIIDFFGGWPVVEGDKWDMGSFDWKEMTYKFRSRGFSVDYLLDFSVTIDSKNSTLRIIELDAGSLALSRKYFMKGLEDRVVSAYYAYMVDMAVLLGADKEKAKAELMDSLNFEMQLANVSLPSEERRDYEKLYNKMTLTELQQKFPTIPWMEYFSTLLGPTILIEEDEPVLVVEPQYISALEHMLQHTPKRIQANYLMWRVVSAIANYMPERFRQRTLKYHTAISGSTERQARWKECVGIASGSVTYAVGSLYVKKFFKQESKKNALELVQRIRNEMYTTLQTIDWMDEETRKNALEKAASIKEYIAYPDELLDDNKLAEFYKDYDVSNITSFLEAILRTAMFASNFMMVRLRHPVNKTEWLIHARPAVVLNGLYNGLENSDFYWGEFGQPPNKNRHLAGLGPSWAVEPKYDVSNVSSFLEAILKTTMFATNYTMTRLRQPVNKTEWLRHASPAVVNAFYNGLENSIEFPAGILQGVFFNSGRPSYMNYGGIGFVIGHEITHGFDDQGRQFDKEGNLKEWWAPETKSKYLKKAQCIIYQYGNYTDKQVNMKLNGINTQGENIADNGGLKQAYKAYVSWIKDHAEEKRLPGLQKYSPRQMFWISAASTWCTVYRNESLSNRITTGYHSPGEFRVKGPFSNSEDFANDFNCPSGSVMNPLQKCAVW